jgi:toxin ParE1/3/4
MQGHKIVLTWEAIYDITDAADYIEKEFGKPRANRFQSEIKNKIKDLSDFSSAYPQTQILYRGYVIRKRSFPPAIIFYIVLDKEKEIHVLRVLRHENDWENTLSREFSYTYPN